MAYLGNDLQVAYESYKIIDDISGSFNSSLTSFALQVGGVTPVPFPINPQQCLISVNGVVQEPDPTGTSGFNLVGSNIVFASAPTTGHSFFGIILAGADYVNVGVNYPSGSESAPSITFDTDLDTGIYNPAANELGLVTNSNEAVKIDSAGNVAIDTNVLYVDAVNDSVGVGTASPAANTKFDLSGTYAANITAVGALDIDCSTANYFTKTINGNSTFTFSNVPSSRAFSFTLELTHTSGTVTWPASVKWPADTAPTLTTGKTHLFIFLTDDGGTRWRGAALVDYTT